MFKLFLLWQACLKLIDRFKEREENVKVVGTSYFRFKYSVAPLMNVYCVYADGCI